MTQGVLAVLAFHKIGAPAPEGWDTWNYVATARFRQMLEVLRDEGWNVIDARQFIASLRDPAILPRRAALITFDDAYVSLRSEALPILHDFGYPAVVFVPTGYVGGTNAFDEGNEPREAICDWEDLRALEASNVSVQAHSQTHPHFSAVTEARLLMELTLPKYEIEAHLGKPVDLLAYPYGDRGHPQLAADVLRRSGYRGAFSYGGRVCTVPHADPFAIERLALGADSDLARMLRTGGQE